MRSSRRRITGWGAIVGAMLLLAGCENDPVRSPTTASDAGRDVFGSNADPSVDETARTAEDRPNDERSVPNQDDTVHSAPKPVVASRPAVRDTSVASAAMSIADSPAADLAGTPPRSPDVAEPNADLSQFPGGIIPASPNAQPLPGGPRLLVPERHFQATGRPRALQVSYDDLDLLKVLNMGDPLPADVVDQFPDWLSELDGKVIRLRGFMYPAYTQELKSFILTRDTGACCFGPNPKVYYLVGVKLKEGHTVQYIGDRPFDVVGTFHIDPVYNEGQWYQLYRISDAAVIQ